jgi:hypothetical protein
LSAVLARLHCHNSSNSLYCYEIEYSGNSEMICMESFI